MDRPQVSRWAADKWSGFLPAGRARAMRAESRTLRWCGARAMFRGGGDPVRCAMGAGDSPPIVAIRDLLFCRLVNRTGLVGRRSRPSGGRLGRPSDHVRRVRAEGTVGVGSPTCSILVDVQLDRRRVEQAAGLGGLGSVTAGRAHGDMIGQVPSGGSCQGGRFGRSAGSPARQVRRKSGEFGQRPSQSIPRR